SGRETLSCRAPDPRTEPASSLVFDGVPRGFVSSTVIGRVLPRWTVHACRELQSRGRDPAGAGSTVPVRPPNTYPRRARRPCDRSPGRRRGSASGDVGEDIVESPERTRATTLIVAYAPRLVPTPRCRHHCAGHP